MKNNEDKMDFSELLEVLGDSELVEEIKADEKYQTVTDDNVNDFVLEYGSRLVKDAMNAINKVTPKITSAQNADEIAALSELMRAANSTLANLTKISLQNKKEKSDRENKQLEYNHKKELKFPITNNTQVIINGTREDIFKQIMEAEKEAEATDVEVIEDED
jgi:hypothetical protein